MRARTAALVALTALRVATSVLPVSAGAPPAVVYRPPVPGEVVDDFDAPAQPWSPGNRGVDLAARAGDPVASAADGTVTFAGPVAGATWVTIAHADGVLTSYGPLGGLAVTTGDRVTGGQRIGTVAGAGLGTGRAVLGGSLHWGARRDGVYLDPLLLLATWRPALLGADEGRFTGAPAVPRYARRWTGRRDGVLGELGLLEPSPRARHAGWVFPPNPNRVIAVAGLGSSTDEPALDVTHLGYAAADVTHLSYAGRDGAAQATYDAQHTYAGVEAAADRLDAELRAHAREHPGRAVDLVGHSMGGVVILHWLLTRYDPADPALPAIGHAVTVASPLEGADLVDAIRSAVDPLYVPVVDAVGRRFGAPPLRSQALDDLQVGSPLLQELRAAWRDATDDRYAGPLALGTEILTVGASRDLVVPEHRSDLPGTHHVVLPGSHDGVRHTEASRQVIRDFLADDPVAGGRGGAGHHLSYGTTVVETLLGEAVGHVTSPLKVLRRLGTRADRASRPMD